MTNFQDKRTFLPVASGSDIVPKIEYFNKSGKMRGYQQCTVPIFGIFFGYYFSRFYTFSYEQNINLKVV